MRNRKRHKKAPAINFADTLVKSVELVPDINETAMLEILEIAKSEFDIELQKKNGFENRAGFIMAFLVASCVLWIDKIRVVDILALCNIPLVFWGLLQIITGSAFYIFFAVAVMSSLRIIGVRSSRQMPLKTFSQEF